MSLEEAEHYLEDRRAKGFTVIQAVILAELGGLRVPNANGDLPLIGNDPLQPNHAYFRHVDAILRMAERKGLVMALLPTWGDKFNRKWGEGPEIFTPENARGYGAFLGERYARRNIVWVLGGDRNPETPQHLAIVRAMAAGIESAGARQPMTYHPQGGSRSWDFFKDDYWIDFHMFQSGHGERDIPNYRMTLAGGDLRPPKPVLDGEPRYEDHPINWKPELGWFDAFDVRQAAWWSMLSGAAGHTYGDHNVWQMWQPGRQPISAARTPWRAAIKHPGSAHMGVMRRILEANGFGNLRPAQQLLAVGGEGGRRHVAAETEDGKKLIVYTPYGDAVRLKSTAISPSFVLRWFNPRNGTSVGVSPMRPELFPNEVQFDAPGEPARGNDWVLVVERVGGIPS